MQLPKNGFDRAFRSDDSLFTPGVPIWSRRWLDDLRRRFLDRPDEWNRHRVEADFFEKFGAATGRQST